MFAQSPCRFFSLQNYLRLTLSISFELGLALFVDLNAGFQVKPLPHRLVIMTNDSNNEARFQDTFAPYSTCSLSSVARIISLARLLSRLRSFINKLPVGKSHSSNLSGGTGSLGSRYLDMTKCGPEASEPAFASAKKMSE